MRQAAQVIEDELEVGADVQEVLDALEDEGWKFIYPPNFQRWQDHDYEVFAYIGSYAGRTIKVTRRITKRSVAHMDSLSIDSVREGLLKYYMNELEVLMMRGEKEKP